MVVKITKEKTTKILKNLLARRITPHECKELLGLRSNSELDALINIYKDMIETKILEFGLKRIEKMNYLQIRSLCKSYGPKKLEGIMKKVELDWENFKISGFDYRYVAESIKDDLDVKFIIIANSIGRMVN